MQHGIFQQIKACPGFEKKLKDINLHDKITSVISIEKEIFNALSVCLKMEVPFPVYTNNQSKTLSEKIKRSIFWKPLYEIEQLTFENLIDATLAHNYKDVIAVSTINSKYDIYIAVSGISVDRIGVDYYEISSDKSFTSDLGID